MLRPLLNAAYWCLIDGQDEKGRRRLDRNLDAPLTPPPGRPGVPVIDPGAAQLLNLMRGGR